jgi:preprotein translocase subunit SecA
MYIQAKELQQKDVNYIVKGKEVIIVDEFTGRTMSGRRWSDGLHQVSMCEQRDPLSSFSASRVTMIIRWLHKMEPRSLSSQFVGLRCHGSLRFRECKT